MPRRSLAAAALAGCLTLVGCVTLTGCVGLSPTTPSSGATVAASPGAPAPGASADLGPSGGPSGPVGTPSPAASSASPTPSPTATPWVDVRQHCAFVEAARTANGRLVLDLDYVLFLTGPEAEDAAEADGAEPPPNDFYIVNDSTRLRTSPVSPDAPLTVVLDAAAGQVPEGRPMAQGDWAAALRGPHGDAYRSTPYWVTIIDGTITEIRQQYVP